MCDVTFGGSQSTAIISDKNLLRQLFFPIVERGFNPPKLINFVVHSFAIFWDLLGWWLS